METEQCKSSVLGPPDHHDATQYSVLPWMIIATIDAYQDMNVHQKVKALTWIEKATDKIDPSNKELRKSDWNWLASELLIALKYEVNVRQM
jgi:hypothetical protein